MKKAIIFLAVFISLKSQAQIIKDIYIKLPRVDSLGGLPASAYLKISDTPNIRVRPIAGTNMTITGTYPNLTFNSTGSGSGSVTSIAFGLGLTGGTITSTGSVAVDTSSVTILSRQRAAATYEPIISVLPIAKGGTNNGSLSVTNGNLIYSDGSKLVGLGVGGAGQHLVGGTLPHWVDTATGGGGTTYTFSTGLNNAANTITAKLSTGVVGGQSVIGGTASGDSLRLSSTTNATKGNINFGTFTFDERRSRFLMPTITQGATIGNGMRFIDSLSGIPISGIQGLSATAGYLLLATNKYYTGTGWADMGQSRAGLAMQMQDDGVKFMSFNTGTTLSNRFQIAPGGNVGIGDFSTFTSSIPPSNLTVAGTSSTVFRITDPAGIQYSYTFGRGGSIGHLLIAPDPTNSAPGFEFLNGSVSIGNTSETAFSSGALLDLNSTTKTLKLMSMTKTQRNAIASPAAGSMIYQNDNTPGLRVYNGTNWMRFTETAD
jgi:hypothetical protein